MPQIYSWQFSQLDGGWFSKFTLYYKQVSKYINITVWHETTQNTKTVIGNQITLKKLKPNEQIWLTNIYYFWSQF